MSLYETLMRSWAVEALVWSAIMMAAVLLLRRPVQRLFGARIAYALWALPALRMVLPRIPGLEQQWRIELGGAALWSMPAGAAAPLPVEHVAVGIVSPDLLPSLPPEGPSLAATLPPPDPALAIDWPALLLAVWLGGAALFLLRQLLAHRSFLIAAAAEATVVQRDGGITVLSAPGVPGPLATGVLRRLILLPSDFTQRYAPAERRLVLAHEVAHHCRGDLVANMAALVLLSLHWFNPLAHRAYRIFRADQELACDETVLSNESSAEARADYGRAIVRTVARRAPVAACTMHAAGLLKRRLQMMTLEPRGLARLAAGALIGATLVGGGLALTASGAIARAADELPVPPTPPAPPAAPAAPAAVNALTPPTPPSPPRFAARSGRRGTWIIRDGGRTVRVVDGRDIEVNGRKVDPDSAEGRAILAEAAEAGREGLRAAEEGRRAAREGLRAAEEGRRAAEEARRTAEETRLHAVNEAMHAREEARREGERARLEGLRAGEEARREAVRARQEGLRAATEGRRAGEEARRAGLLARTEALRAGEEARRAGASARAAARAGAATYAASYVDADAINAEVRRSLAEARAEIARSTDLSERVKAQTLRALDASIARQR